jgi:hypothetical protein
MIQWFLLLICIAGSLSVLGCDVMIVGGIALDGEPAKIYITEDESTVTGCEYIKQVSASTRWGGILQNKALKKVISEITHDAEQAGANVLLIRSKTKGWGGRVPQVMLIAVQMLRLFPRITREL